MHHNDLRVRALLRFRQIAVCRTGDSTAHFDGYGDGASDVFVATLSGANKYRVVTSSAVQTVAITNGTVIG